MNTNRKLKTLRLVRFGEVHYDQQKRLIVLCGSCHRHYLSLESFHSHLTKCIGVRHIVNSINELHYDDQKRETRLLSGKQEVYIYEPNMVGCKNTPDCEIDWEAELEDPRWYTDVSRTQSSKAKQPPTNAKENVAKNHTRKTETMKVGKPMYTSTPEPPCKRFCVSTPMRTILANQQQHKSAGSAVASVASTKLKNDIIIPQKRNGIMRPPPTTAAISTSPAVITTSGTAIVTTPAVKTTIGTAIATSPAVKTTSGTAIATTPAVKTTIGTAIATTPAVKTTSGTAIATTPAAESPSVAPIPTAGVAFGDTQQILDKLRACGVEVKIRNPRENKQVDDKKQLALEIMRKLQSNGIKCTKVSNTKS